MPELPEVEVTRMGLADRIAGARVLSASLGKPLRWPLGCDASDLTGRTVRGVRRRGKYLLLDLDGGMLLLHLGMSGSLHFAQGLPAPGKHDHFDLVTTQGVLRLHDPRRFGAVVYASAEDAPIARKLLARLGVEPLSDDFELAAFQRGLKERHAAIKQVLLAGELVVGVGNIYACEALFQAGIRPTTLAARIGPRRATRLHAAIRDVLARAVAKGGSTLRDFSNTDGEAGYFQMEAAVYGRAGLGCKVCGADVKTMRQGQRSSYFCPKCQRN
ncbi:MAG: bifunctional DNA-formamidopyrimidine glycosylase/DNA-(apurinic or apyrimidinic site) lyase [Burkholderiaceae bacterium]